MRLTAGHEAALYHIRCIVDEILYLLRILEADALEYRLLCEDVRRILMDAHGIRHNRFQIGQCCRQLFDVDGNLRCSISCMLSGIGHNHADHIAPAMKLFILEYLTGGLKHGTSLVELALGHDIGSACGDQVLRQDNLDHARHLLGFFGMDRKDLRMMGDPGLNDGSLQGARRHLQGLIIAVIGKTGNLAQTVGTHKGLSEEIAFLRIAGGEVLHGPLAADYLGRCHDGIHDLLVAGAATDVLRLLEPVSYFLSGRVIILFQKRIGRNDKAGHTEAALHGAVADPGLLQRVQMLRCADALDGGDLGIVLNSGDLLVAGPLHLAVDDQVAGTAYADAASHLASGEAQTADHVRKLIVLGIAHKHALHSVDDKHLFLQYHPIPPYHEHI